MTKAPPDSAKLREIVRRVALPPHAQKQGQRLGHLAHFRAAACGKRIEPIREKRDHLPPFLGRIRRRRAEKRRADIRIGVAIQQMQQGERRVRPAHFPAQIAFLRRAAPFSRKREGHAQVAVSKRRAHGRPIAERAVNGGQMKFMMIAHADKDVFDAQIGGAPPNLRDAFVERGNIPRLVLAAFKGVNDVGNGERVGEKRAFPRFQQQARDFREQKDRLFALFQIGV